MNRVYTSLLKNPSALIRSMLDQNLTDLARAALQETTKKVDPAIEQELERLSTQVMSSTYDTLAALLKAKKWEEADKETDKVMLEVAGQTERGYLREEDFRKFPCEDLLTIDRLWIEASNGHFGFSVQKKIWTECGSPSSSSKEDWNRFCVRIGWQYRIYNSEMTAYSTLKKDLPLSPVGELPAAAHWHVRREYFSFLAQRLVNCNTTAFQPQNKNNL